MHIFYSGTCSNDALPEFIVKEKKPNIMQTFFDFQEKNSASIRRFKAHRNNRKKKRHVN